MIIVIDSVLSQLAPQAIGARWARLSRQLVTSIATREGATAVILDRGGTPPHDGAVTYPFPSYRFIEAAADSGLLQKFCDFVQADVFVSSGLTTPLLVPTVQLVLAAIDPAAADQASPRLEVERRLACAYSSATLCDSAATMKALARGRDLDGFARPEVVNIAWDSPSESETIERFCDAAVARIRQAREQAMQPNDRTFREKWRQLREMLAAVDVT
ncbi:MAG: hypothetical protein HZA66_24000 [Rhodopseudomonas palustris]|uniref:Uncharacterized protein n=1 Tax=Rhodopseudomonas palustris TaxID=1076 RepID=A0A933W3T3_RHOPL|nr:hypothetical protein [Rhodopseudomonas palustris]